MINKIELAANNMWLGGEGVEFSTDSENNTPQLTLYSVDDETFTFDTVKLAPVVMILTSYEMWDLVYYINRIIKISNNVFELIEYQETYKDAMQGGYKDIMCVCIQKGIKIGNAEANMYETMRKLQETYGRDIFEIAMHLLEHENCLPFDALSDIESFIRDRS